jgi:hypothetical protein
MSVCTSSGGIPPTSDQVPAQACGTAAATRTGGRWLRFFSSTHAQVLLLVLLLAPAATAAFAQCPTATLPATVPGESLKTFTSTTGLSLTEGSSGTQPYGNTYVNVSGISGTITRVAVSLNCLNGGGGFYGINNYAFLLAPPNGSSNEGFDFLNSACVSASNSTLTLDDSESSQTLDGYLSDCTYGNSAYGFLPYNGYGPGGNGYGTADFPDYSGTVIAAPGQGTGAFSLFNGLSPNGKWYLHIAAEYQDFDPTTVTYANVSISNWTLAVYYTSSSTITSTTLASTPTTPFTTSPNNSVTLTATVTSSGGPANGGTVTFKDGTTTLCSAAPLNGSGQATCSTSFSTEGTHSVTGTYSGTSSYGSSGGSIQVTVSKHTSQSGNQYCNTGTISSGNISTSPYPSEIFIGSPDTTTAPTGGGVIDTVSVTLNSLSTGAGASEENQNLLLVGPAGQELVFAANGGNADNSDNVTSLTFADSGAYLPFNTSYASSTIYQPLSYFNESGEPETGQAAFPSGTPAFTTANESIPTGMSNFENTFTGSAATGTWQLYYSSTGTGSSSVGGWCLNFTMTGGDGTSTSIASDAATKATNQTVTLTATVSDTSKPGTQVSSGTVSFSAVSSGGAVSLGQAAVSSGTATITVAANTLTEGTYDLVADFADTSNTFGPSHGQAAQRMNNPPPTPTVSGNTYTYCNTTPILVPYDAPGSTSSGTAAPYPSNINVTNLPGTVNAAAVQLNFSKSYGGFQNIDDVASLLTAPNGSNIDFFSNVGGFGTASSGVSYIVSDSASNSAIGQTNSSYIAPSGTYPPESYLNTSTNQPDAFPACQQLISDCSSTVGPAAPSSGYNYATSEGSASFSSVFGTGPASTLNGSGVWSLYLDSDVANLGGALGSSSLGTPSWCMEFSQNAVTVGVTAGHDGTGNSGDFAQGEQSAPITVAVANSGPGATGDADGNHPLTITDTLNSALTYASYSGTGWSCSAAGQNVTCTNHAAVAQGSSYPTLDIDVNVATNASSSLSNSVQVSGAGVTTTSGNDTITVDPAPALAVSKTHTGTFAQGQNAQWNIAVSNTKTGSLTGGTVTVSDTLPTGYTLVNYSGTGWSCSGTSTVSCTSTQGVSGGAAYSTLVLTVSVPTSSPATVSNTALAWGGGDLVHTTQGTAASGSDNNVSVTQNITPTFTWNPPGTIIFGTGGTNVLNATVSCGTGCGNITYTQTPSGGGTPASITTTSSLAAGSYTITANFSPTGSGYNPNSDAVTLVVNGESAWIVDGSGGLSELAGNGAAITSSADSGGNGAAAIDATGNVWTIGSGTYLLEDISQTGTLQHGISSGGGLDAPQGIAIDGNSQVWVTNSGNNSFSLFGDNGNAVSPSSGFTGLLSSPSGIAVDLGGSVWIANKGNNSLTRVLGVAAPAAPLSTAAANNKTGARP